MSNPKSLSDLWITQWQKILADIQEYVKIKVISTKDI